MLNCAGADPCVNHTVTDDPMRQVPIVLTLGDPGLGDHDLVPGWYRFLVKGSNAVIATISSPVRLFVNLFLFIWLMFPYFLNS